MDAYTKSLEDMLMYTFDHINKSKSPEANMKWFVSKEAREWYEAYKEIINSVEQEPVTVDEVVPVVQEPVKISTPDVVTMKEDIEKVESKDWIDNTFKQ